MTWIFEDVAIVSPTDRELLLNYLAQRNIKPEGYFHEALQDDEGSHWRYPAFAVKHFASCQKLQGKLKLLCSRRGRDDNDVERNYQNQLVEFRALYALTALMGYQFTGLDEPSGKPYAGAGTDCDIALTRSGKTVFADAKDSSGEILSQDEVEHVIIEGESTRIRQYEPKVEVDGWLRGQIRDVDRKGADLLVCYLPGWKFRGFEPPELKEYLNSILPKVLTWTSDRPHWTIASNGVQQVVIVKPMGCFVIELSGINATQHQ